VLRISEPKRERVSRIEKITQRGASSLLLFGKFWSDEIEYEIGTTYNTYGQDEKYVQNFSRKT
jgi:hypothetical protein